MTLTLYWLAGISAAELLMWLPPAWGLRRGLACAVIIALSVASGLMFGSTPSVWTGLLLVFSIYRIINLLRVLEGRLQPKRLYSSTRRTSWWLIGCQIVVAAGAGLSHHYLLTGVTWLYILAAGQLAVALILMISTLRHLRTTRPDGQLKNLGDKELPALTVAIPARNETNDLEACLRSLVASDYPKLEILVLDDCSQNKRTPGIIRDFAQSGVRFVAGQAPPRHWLAKNYAYHQLAAEANGELLLFCGVDTRFQTGSLRSMIEVMSQRRKQMVSFMPRNPVPPSLNIESLLVQPARYAWELSLPRRLLRRPPVLSTCWLITAQALRGAGGLEAVSHSIAPESYFARSTARHQDGYSFLQSGTAIGLSSAKSLIEQCSTAVRTRYPQLHRRPELVALSVVGELAALVLPFALLVAAGVAHLGILAAINLVTSLLLAGFYSKIVRLTYRQFLSRGLWALPLAAIYDIGLLNYSMWRYEFREVIWKGRNVCVPLLKIREENAKS
ncbi:MAG TPA: glycosyltransferase [Candidatus Saccharimonadales bacterium]|nr:glycosyltransferase [Candidatus Saccharimonadales bacterium]